MRTRWWIGALVLLGTVASAETAGEERLDGETLFTHVWTEDDPLASGNGLGPLFNARSCAECHHQGGVGGAGTRQHDQELLPGRGMIARFGTSETYPHRRSAWLRPPHIPRDSCGTAIAAIMDPHTPRRRQTPALYGVGLLDTVTEADLQAARRLGEIRGVSGRVATTDDGRPGKLGWKGQHASLDDFVHGACAHELGLGTPTVPEPVDPSVPDAEPGPPDLDGDQVQALVAFVSALPRPATTPPDHTALRGRVVFDEIGCAACHQERIGEVVGAYTDLLLHDMGPQLSDASRGYGMMEPVGEDEKLAGLEWRTPPLWGVADTAPYMHDGRAFDLPTAIAHHGGEAMPSRAAWAELDDDDQAAVLTFLGSLRAPGDS